MSSWLTIDGQSLVTHVYLPSHVQLVDYRWSVSGIPAFTLSLWDQTDDYFLGNLRILRGSEEYRGLTLDGVIVLLLHRVDCFPRRCPLSGVLVVPHTVVSVLFLYTVNFVCFCVCLHITECQ